MRQGGTLVETFENNEGKTMNDEDDEVIQFIGDDEILSEGYTVVWNYFLNKWVGIIGSGPGMLYIQILKRCFKDTDGNQKDIAFPKVSTLCKELGLKSRTTLHKWLDTLEDYDFIQRYNRFNQKDDGKTLQTSNIYKVRLSIHLTPEDKILKENEKKEGIKKESGMIIKKGSRRNKPSQEIKALSQEISKLFNCKNKEAINLIKNEKISKVKEALEITKKGLSRKENKVANAKAFFKATLENINKSNSLYSPEIQNNNSLQTRENYKNRFNLSK